MRDYPNTANEVRQTVAARLEGKPVGPAAYEQAWPGEWLYAGYVRRYSETPQLAEAFWQGLLDAYQTAIASSDTDRISRLAYANDLLSRMERSRADIPYSLFFVIKPALLPLLKIEQGNLDCLAYMALLLSKLTNRDEAYLFWQGVRQPLSQVEDCDALQKTRILYALNGLVRTGRWLQTNFKQELEALKLWATQHGWPELPAALGNLQNELEFRRAVVKLTVAHSNRSVPQSRQRWTQSKHYREKEAA